MLMNFAISKTYVKIKQLNIYNCDIFFFIIGFIKAKNNDFDETNNNFSNTKKAKIFFYIHNPSSSHIPKPL